MIESKEVLLNTRDTLGSQEGTNLPENKCCQDCLYLTTTILYGCGECRGNRMMGKVKLVEQSRKICIFDPSRFRENL